MVCQELAIQLRDGKVQLDGLQKVTAELRARHEALKELSEADKAAKNSVDARLYRLEKAFSSQAGPERLNNGSLSLA